MKGLEIAARAQACVGARYRPWGRDPALGLDCAGLAAHALSVSVGRDYALRGGSPDQAARIIAGKGLRRIAPEAAEAGDLLLADAGHGQLHLAIRTTAGFVHADARLARIVEAPGRPDWPILGAWRRD